LTAITVVVNQGGTTLSRKLTVLGGGNTAFSIASNLTLRGYEVTLYELPSFAASVAPLEGNQEIRLTGVAEQGTAHIHRVTCDIREAAESDLLLISIPSYGHQAFADALVPCLRPGHIVLLLPGNLGSLAFARQARETGHAEGVIFAEVDTAPYVCRKLGPAHAHIWGIVTGLGMGVFPGRESAHAVEALADVFPGIWAYPHALACGLNATNPIVHPAGVLMNAGRVEYSRGEFYFYEEGVMPAVVRAIKAVDAERLAVAAALGTTLDSVEENYWKGGFGPKGDLWATINGSRMLTQLRAPGSLETRWLTEDIPFGIASWALIGREQGVPTPVIGALTELGSVVTGMDCWAVARTPAHLGIAGLRPKQVVEYLSEGR
jgi:opine dehydrogenase